MKYRNESKPLIISHSTLPGKSGGHVDTMLIGERLANWKVIFSGSTC